MRPAGAPPRIPAGQPADTLADAAAATAAELGEHAPHLLAAFTGELPAAAAVVGGRLLGALVREGLAEAPRRPGRRHGFDRVEYDHPGVDDPTELLPAALSSGTAGAGTPGAGTVGAGTVGAGTVGAGTVGAGTLRAELSNAVVNLALARARIRRRAPCGRSPAADADSAALHTERLAVTGHNLHPCGRTRLGWAVTDVLAHDLEAGRTRIGFVAVHKDLHVGEDLGQVLAAAYPDLPTAPPGYRLQPVHAWQRDAVVGPRHAGLLRSGALRALDGELVAEPTAALRTLLLPPGADGSRHYLKVSLDIQVTSTRRGISVASTHNGPVVSRLLHRLLADDPAAGTVLLMTEPAGAAVPAGTGRDLSAIARVGLTGRLYPGERAVPGGALPATDPDTGRSVLAGLVAAYARTRRRTDDSGTARAFLRAYTRLLLPPLLRLATRYGVALEAHLQNCLPTFVDGVPHRVAWRDFAGLRLHRPRLAAAGLAVPLWPGSVIATDDVSVLRAKLGYTALQAHLGELVVRLVDSHDLDEAAAWHDVRDVVDDTYEPLLSHPDTAAAAAADHAALTAARVPHKALVRMRLPGTRGDVYVPVSNPLHRPGHR